MKSSIFILSAAALLFTACNKSSDEDERARLNDTYHLDTVEFFLDEKDGLSVTERPRIRPFENWGNVALIADFQDVDTISSAFYFEENLPYKLAIDVAKKIQIPQSLENGILRMGEESTWTFRNGDPEERLTGSFYDHSLNIPAKHQTIVSHTKKISTIKASFNASFVGEKTGEKVVVQGNWEGREIEHDPESYSFSTDTIIENIDSLPGR
ncbi:MAG: hypothetical protein LBV32_00920 [Tannerellaceae bacterium]|nr:hypothetical protein [Tannerellaceae bacterium]